MHEHASTSRALVTNKIIAKQMNALTNFRLKQLLSVIGLTDEDDDEHTLDERR